MQDTHKNFSHISLPIYIDNILPLSSILPSRESTEAIVDPEHTATDRSLSFAHGVVDGGVRTHDVEASCYIQGSSGFIWLLTLRPSEWSSVVLLGSIPERLLEQINTAWNKKLCTVKLLPRSKLQMSFGCGSVGEFSSLFAQTPTPSIWRFTEKPRRLQSEGQFIRLPHQHVGGVTSEVGYFFIRNSKTLVTPLTVRRNIGSVIDHGRFLPTTKSYDDFVDSTSILPAGSPRSRIRIPTHLGDSGFGFRSLSNSELCKAWDFPLWSVTDKLIKANFIGDIPPLKAGLILADLLVKSLGFTTTFLGSSYLASIPTRSANEKGTFLVSIGKCLPLQWIDESLITEKAAKSDKASIPTHLWDRRISLPLEVPSVFLSPLRRFFFAIACRNVVISFSTFMENAFGRVWLDWSKIQENLQLFPFLRGDVRWILRSQSQSTGGFRNESSNIKNQNIKNQKRKRRSTTTHASIKRQRITQPSSTSTELNQTSMNSSSSSMSKPGRLLLPSSSRIAAPPSKKLKPNNIELLSTTKDIGWTSMSIHNNVKTNVRNEFEKDLHSGLDGIKHYLDSSWWKWDRGSSLLHWRWGTSASCKASRDGWKLYCFGNLPNNMRKPKGVSKDQASKIAEKIGDIRRKEYVIPVPKINNYIDYFAVPKDDDVRIVYDATKCLLNDVFWAPSFWLPTPSTVLRQLSFSYWSADIDLGEMFLNFPLPEWLHSYLGIRISHLRSEIEKLPGQRPVTDLEAWGRCLMGFRPSPFIAIRFYYHAEEFIVGDRNEKNNPFRWDTVVENCPGSENFDPRLPWIYKLNNETNGIAGSLTTFVDDGRATGSSSEQAWQIGQRAGKKLQYLGCQNASRKTKPPAQINTGAWAGSIIEADDDNIYKSVAQGKWDKVVKILTRIEAELESSLTNKLSFKPLERDRGFLVHLAMTYTVINPFLKGVHQTIDSWRPNRYQDGWKMKANDYLDKLAALESDEERNVMIDAHNIGHPSHVAPASRLTSDLKALRIFFSKEKPTKICMRARRWYQVNYGFGDASGEGFGDNWLTPEGISYHFGVWSEEVSSESSNYREMRNSLDALRREGEAGRLKNAFVIYATDNSVTEAALFKGTSDSPLLLAMVIEFHALQMEFGFQAFVSHVSGLRMIAQGGDGLSRGALNEGVMGGLAYKQFIPFHLSAFTRAPNLKALIIDLVASEGNPPVFLDSKDWFTRGHDIISGEISPDGHWRPVVQTSVLVWAPPPAICDVAFEELRKARIKRHSSTHFIICPRLMTPLWLKQMYKCCDLVIDIPANSNYWPPNMFEPCLLGICFPYLSSYPWSLRGTPKMHALRRKVCKVWKEQPMVGRNLLHEFYSLSRKFPSMQSELVRKMLYFESEDKISQARCTKSYSFGR